MRKIKKILWLGALLLSCAVQGQHLLRGKVVHAKTNEALPFVNIAIKGTSRGTTSDVEGRFSISWSGPSAEIQFSFVGFERFGFQAKPETEYVVIKLKEQPTELDVVIIRPENNPAFRIIRNAIENKSTNDPENLSSFSYNSYNKLYLTMEGVPDTVSSEFRDSLNRAKPPIDSSKWSKARRILYKRNQKKYAAFNKFTKTNHIFVTESYTERKYLKPDFTKETVLANKMTGVKEPFFAFLATNFQPFTFYRDFIPLFGKNYVNPISKGSIERYDFTLMDTVYHQSDSVFIISFEPLPGKQFDGLKGQLYISNNGWAIEHVIAQPADDKVLVESRIQQKYEKTNGHWFPVQLNAELRFKEYKVGNKKMMYVSRSYLTNVEIDPAISKKEFGILNLEFAPTANKQDDAFWNSHRTDSLKKKEANTYQFYDSLGPKLKRIDRSVKLIESLSLGRLSAGPFYLPVNYLLKFNKYEETRFGLGLQTNEKISKLFSLEGYAGYGVKDQAWKYGGALRLNLIPRKEGFLRFSYQQDLSEPGGPDFMKVQGSSVSNQSIRTWLGSQMDSVQQYKVEFGFRPFHFAQLNVFLRQQNRNPTYAYSFVTDKDPAGLQKNFIATEVGLQWRYAYKEAYTQIGNGKVVTNYAFPQINIALSHGISGMGDGQYNFSKVQFLLDQRWMIRGLGKTTIQIDAGDVVGNVPYSYLFIGKGARFDKALLNSFVVNNYFQTMSLYEFLSDRYAYLFFSHNFGRIAGTNSRYFRPEFGITQSIGYGSLDNPNAHQGVTFKTMEKGFFESGLTLTNIFRFKYVHMFYYGIGGGVYYRYGAYALPDDSENLAVKIIVTASF